MKALHFTIQALLEGKLTQPYYLFQEREWFHDGDKVTEADFLYAKRVCCRKIIDDTVQTIMDGSVYTFDWRPTLRKALDFLGKRLEEFVNLKALNRQPSGQMYPWPETEEQDPANT